MTPTRRILLNAAVAAVYAVLTVGLAPLSYGPVQVRISECLTLLAYNNKNYLPGLILGCCIANFGSPLGIADILVGTAATALAVCIMSGLHNLYAASFVPVVVNGVIIGLELYGLGLIPTDLIFPTMVYIGAGELVSVSLIGIGLYRLLLQNPVVKSYLQGRSANK